MVAVVAAPEPAGGAQGAPLRWAGSQASGEDTASYYNFSEAPLEAQVMEVLWIPCCRKTSGINSGKAEQSVISNLFPEPKN